MNRLISVIVPIYQVETYLARCIDSLLRQTYKNLEIILVDDGSPDQCGHICDQYAELDSRIKVIHKANGGLSDARNAGIDIATGEFIGFVDSDDWIASDMYEYLHTGIVESGADISICGFWVVNGKKREMWTKRSTPYLLSTKEALKELIHDHKIQNYAWNKLYRKEVFDNVRYPVGRVFEDIGTTYLLFAQAQSIMVLDKAKYFYFRHQESIVGEWNIKSLIDSFYLKTQRHSFILRKFPHLERVSMLSCMSSLQHITDAYVYGNPSLQRAYLNQIHSEVFPFFDSFKNQLFDTGKIGRFQQLEYVLFRKFGHSSIPYQKLSRRVFPVYKKLRHKKWFTTNAVTQSMFKQNRLYGEFTKTKGFPKILLICSADYGNLGDQAITYAQIKFFEAFFPHYHIVEVYANEIIKFGKFIAQMVNTNDIVTIQGGGNFGDIYQWAEEARRSVIQHFIHHRITILPSTIQFSEGEEGEKELQISIEIYNKHPDLVLVARERQSYEMICSRFQNSTNLIVPDIVLYLKFAGIDGLANEQQRNGILLCLRRNFTDNEGLLTKDDIFYINQLCLSKSKNVRFIDTVQDEPVNKTQREKVLFAKFEEFCQAQLVVTDRLHGMIFAAITGTPCIALKSFNHKLSSSYEWLEHLHYIQFIEFGDTTQQRFEGALDELLRLESCEYDNSPLLSLYKELANAIR